MRLQLSEVCRLTKQKVPVISDFKHALYHSNIELTHIDTERVKEIKEQKKEVEKVTANPFVKPIDEKPEVFTIKETFEDWTKPKLVVQSPKALVYKRES